MVSPSSLTASEAQLMVRLRHDFMDPSLLATALTHSTWAHENPGGSCSYERLEFLGDAVLQLLVSEALFARHTQAPEGELSRRRAQVVREETLVSCAKTLELGGVIRLGQGQRRTELPDSVLADVVEALLGAIYLDGGLDASRRFFTPVVLPHLDSSHSDADPKTRLQEWCHRHHKGQPRYDLVETTGPSHARLYRMDLAVGALRFGPAEGTSKKAAQMQCARLALAYFERERG